MVEELTNQVAVVCAKVLGQNFEVNLVRTEEEFGDYSTNVAMQAAKKLQQSPKQLAEKIAQALQDELDQATKVSVAGPGFINITLKNEVIFEAALVAKQVKKSLKGQQVVAEYSDPNPFKVLHGGHLYTSLVGDGIANLLETAGANVHRVNFGGDVGLHVAKAMWAIIKELSGENPKELEKIPKPERLKWVSGCYVKGNQAYEENEANKQAIVEINKRIYKLHDDQDKTSDFARIYWTCRQWSYDGFDELYKKLRMQPFEKYYPESEVADQGQKQVEKGLDKGIFKKSDGAVVFEGEPEGLHTRVFINSEGLPTYEAKDLGLALSKWDDYHFDKSLIITGNDIEEYMKVVIAAASHFEPKAAERTIHRTHGQIKLAGGVKMSSRKGNILTAEEILNSAYEASKLLKNQNDDVVLGAVRYSFLKTRLGGDIIYDPKESVGLEGNSGPYIQYALVRARSILKKTEDAKDQNIADLEKDERRLARKISEYPEVFEASLSSYSPHHICNYLYELAQIFNSFYEKNRVIGDGRADLRLNLVKSYEQVLSAGLSVLGMPKPEKM